MYGGGGRGGSISLALNAVANVIYTSFLFFFSVEDLPIYKKEKDPMSIGKRRI